MSVRTKLRWRTRNNKNAVPEGTAFLLFLLLVYGVLSSNWVELAFLVLLTWVLLYLIIKTGVVGMAFTDAIFVALGYQFNESIL